MFGITAIKVALMMAYGVPGFLMLKGGILKESAISAFAKLLLYVCQPALTVYSLNAVDCTGRLALNMAVAFTATLAVQIVLIFAYSLIFKKKMTDSAHRIASVASACGNVGFLGIPLLERLLPEYPEAVAISCALSISMNLLAWTIGLRMITGDKKFISLKSVVLNPATLSFLAILPLFLLGIKLPELVAEPIELLGRMSTPVCMTVLGMRLATKKFSAVFGNIRIYPAVVAKLIVFPVLIATVFALIMPDRNVSAAVFILSCCPSAAMVQSLAEAHGGDSASAADIVLATNILCILTVPLMWTAFCAIPFL